MTARSNTSRTSSIRARLRQVPGVRPVTALPFVLTIGIRIGFGDRVMWGRSSASCRVDVNPAARAQLRISKAGNSEMRTLLVQCAQYILGRFGPDTDLKRWGTAMAARGGKNAKRRAIIAVARKLSVLLHKLWLSGAVDDPLYNAAAALKSA